MLIGGPLRRDRTDPLWAGAAVLFLLAALGVAALHPLFPAVAGCAALLMAGIAWRRPGAGVFLLAACLPLADAGILTGPWAFDELDVLVLAVLAGTCLAVSRSGHGAVLRSPAERWFVGLTALVILAGCLPGWLRWLDGAANADPTPAWFVQALHASQAEALWHASKAFVWAALLLMAWQAAGAGKRFWWVRRWLYGSVLGLGLVSATALVELMLEHGWPVPARGYRTAAAFWEMRLGGGAIDVYLAATMPVLFWLLLRERRRFRWWAMALLTIASVQVLLSTQSRGVIGAVLVTAVLLALLVRWQPRLCRWRAQQRRQALLVVLVLVIQVAWGLFGGGDLTQRLNHSTKDLAYRVAHWQRGIELLQTPGERWLGLGAGGWSDRYGSQPGAGEYPGRVGWQRDSEDGWQMLLGGPVSDPSIGPRFGVVQRITDRSVGAYRVGLSLNTDRPLELLLSVCERYLIYDRRCQWRRVPVPAAPQGGPSVWQEWELRGNPLRADAALAGWRPRVFSLSVLTPGARADVQRITLRTPAGDEALSNGDFRYGPARWVAAAQGRFEPWHLDNLYLQLWVERGLPGTAALAVLVAFALRNARPLLTTHPREAPALLAALMGVGLLGLLVSVSELPRLTMLLWLLLGACERPEPKTSHIRRM